MVPLAVVIDERIGTLEATTLRPAVFVSPWSDAVMIGVPTLTVVIEKSAAELPLPIATDAGTVTEASDALSATTVVPLDDRVSVTRPVAVTPSGTLDGVTVSELSASTPGSVVFLLPPPHAEAKASSRPIVPTRIAVECLHVFMMNVLQSQGACSAASAAHVGPGFSPGTQGQCTISEVDPRNCCLVTSMPPFKSRCGASVRPTPVVTCRREASRESEAVIRSSKRRSAGSVAPCDGVNCTL